MMDVNFHLHKEEEFRLRTKKKGSAKIKDSFAEGRLDYFASCDFFNFRGMNNEKKSRKETLAGKKLEDDW